VVLVVLLAVLGGLVWLGAALATGRIGGTPSEETPATSSSRVVRTSALEGVGPDVTGVATSTLPANRAVDASPRPASTVGACTDEMLNLVVRAPATVAIGSRPMFQLVVQNTSRTPCVRALDKALQEVVLLDANGARLWGSNDCFPGTGADPRTLAPGVAVSFPLVWSGRSSQPTCTAERRAPAPGAYALRGRLDTKTTAPTPITLR
jgi:hypothetical protein